LISASVMPALTSSARATTPCERVANRAIARSVVDFGRTTTKGDPAFKTLPLNRRR